MIVLIHWTVEPPDWLTTSCHSHNSVCGLYLLYRQISVTFLLHICNIPFLHGTLKSPTHHHYYYHAHPIPLSHIPDPVLCTPHLDSGFRCIPQGPTPLNRSIHLPLLPCVTCTLHMCEKSSQPSQCFSMFCPVFKKKDLKLWAAGHLMHRALRRYKEAKIVGCTRSGLHPNASHLDWK